jgi:A/G-specific adenine glycosylase
LAAAPVDEVLHLWTGLGYYARARNLHRAAQLVVTEQGGRFPQTLEAMQALPGIGRSTAGAILALSMSQRHPILDGNVKRVLSRYFGVAGFPGDAPVERRLWSLAEALTPNERVAHYTQAVMDLGATVCVRSRPLCRACPMSAHCVAHAEGLQGVLPTPRPRKARPTRTAFALIAVRSDGSVLLERRPLTGLWGGLWTFPQFEERAAALRWVTERNGHEPPHPNPLPKGEGEDRMESLGAYAHAFTHFDLVLHPLLVRIDSSAAAVAELDRYTWYDPQRPAKIGLTKPAVELIEQVSRVESSGASSA